MSASAGRRLVLLAAVLLLAGCATVPMTGRKQLSLVSGSEVNALAATEYGKFLKKNPPVRGTPEARMVEDVGRRIQAAVERYMEKHDYADLLAGYDWQFHLVEDEAVNAWCMPGGRVVVYSGILPVTRDETGLAVVMGHEVAHAIAQHGAERMSQQLATQLGGATLAVALAGKSTQTQALAMAAFGAGSAVGILLPFSRAQESEADKMGIQFMAMAGYDPRASIGLWQRMAEASKGSGKPPVFLSTHPSDEQRIERLKKEMPEALKRYEKATGQKAAGPGGTTKAKGK
ncbi:MAG: M48 family metallopeptidase [Acidobacteria bacterium]|nr:M48 family metallopeptidase [Acidobacteriota bacterium]